MREPFQAGPEAGTFGPFGAFMGDYHTTLDHNGKLVYHYKLGVCGDFRYVRRKELAAIEATDSGSQVAVRACLDEPSMLYRFPFPDEDNDGPEQIQKRDMFRTVQFEWAAKGLKHESVWAHIQAHGGGNGNNICFPCPTTKEFSALNLKRSGDFAPVVRLYGERWNEMGVNRTIFTCGYCEAPFSVDRSELDLVRIEFINYWASASANFAEKIADRFRARTDPLPVKAAV